MNDCVAVTLTNGDHFVCVVTVLVMFSVSVAAIWRERRAENRLSRRTAERDDLANANASLLEERSEWISENETSSRALRYIRNAVQSYRAGGDAADVFAIGLIERILDEGTEQPDGGDRR